jgi:hypothetical protein
MDGFFKPKQSLDAPATAEKGAKTESTASTSKNKVMINIFLHRKEES